MFIKSTSTVASHPKLHTYEEGFLLPVLTKDELLFSHRHKGLLRLLRDLAEIPENDFDQSYADVLQNFMEFAQVLPHKTNGVMGSLLNYGLAHTVAVFQKYCQLKRPQATPLIKFAVFTAALLRDVGRVLTNQRIILTDDQGEFLGDWNPFSGSMLGQAKFFKMYPIPAVYLRLEKEVTPLLARQLIPSEYFLWLSSDPLLFADWLAALLDEEGVGAQEVTFAIKLVKRDDIIAVLNTLDGANVDMTEPAATKHAEEFYRWLKKRIATGELAVNTDDASIHVVPEGVLIEKRLFKHYIDVFKLPMNFLALYHEFGNLLGVVKRRGIGYMHTAYSAPSEFSAGGGYSTFSNTNTRGRGPREGMVADPHAIFINKEINSVSSLRTMKPLVAAQYQSPLKISADLKAAPRTK